MIKRISNLSKLTQKVFVDLDLEHAILLIDVDNTLLSSYDKRINDQQKQWIETTLKHHRILLSTNNVTKRQFNVGIDLKLPILMHSFKPFPWRVKAFLKEQKVDLELVVVIGDQTLTDVLLALWLRRPYLLIKPIDIDKHWITRFFRILESTVIDDE